MRRIEVLDQNTIDKIAAGEVVERPASVVKELIENAIDSGANAITVEIKNGGIEFIRITDNGCGIETDQVRKAFLRHATSKLRNIGELSRIASLGFRGEALSSIAAVSRVELITRAQDSITGVRYVIEGGEEKSFEEIGAPYGTTFIMRNLFFNTPVRGKFLKSPVSEANAVSSYVEQLALSHPKISFKYMVNGKAKLYTSGKGELKETVYQLYGREAVKSLIPFKAESQFIHFSGFLGNAEASRGNRSFEIYFVNGRYVKSKLIAKALEEAYQGHLMQHRYPFTVLNIDVDREKVDVNVHPAKLELRFSEQEAVYRQIYECVRKALHDHESIPAMSLEKKAEKKAELPELKGEVLEEKRLPYPIKKENAGKEVEKPLFLNEVQAEKEEKQPEKKAEKEKKEEKKSYPEPFEEKRRENSPKVPELVAEKQMTLFEADRITPEKKKNHRVIGQVFDTYFLVEMDNVFYIIDQHAAHEKVLYEKLMHSIKEHKAYSQMLMPSIVLSLTLRDASSLRENMELFTSFGFEIEEFGGREFRITAVPSDLFGIDVKELFIEILDNLNEPSAGEPKLIAERVASRSCKAAIKGNMKMSLLETKELIDQLFCLDDPYHCPHGRPTMISLSHYELDRKFKRIL